MSTPENLGGSLTLKPNIHRIVETPITDLIREWTGDDNFFTYYHMEKHHFVLAEWTAPAKRTVREYPLFFNHPSEVTPEEIRNVLKLCGPAQTKKLRNAGKEAVLVRGRFLQGFVEEEREREDYRKWARRKVNIHRRSNPNYIWM